MASAFQSPTFDQDVSIRVDEAVGSASISPSGRDVVLASREGLHIIDLDSPYSPPRHIVHRSPWEVADVQWSPFAARDYWVVSTSNQKALVWNLELVTPHAPIEHTLHAHSRAITDINFSAHHPDILATCSIDSYVYCWDLRTPRRPATTYADWFAGATQVKWNRQDSHIIASAHHRKLHIWDDRKGAYPLKTIIAHNTKIYGLDWNRVNVHGVLTCSLDHTIKLWDFSKEENEPERTIRTPYPVWRARHTPFGWGVLAMPQRGDSNLYLYDRRLEEGAEKDGPTEPAWIFEGHESRVKEFLWRGRGGIHDDIDNRDFQLVSWGEDKVLNLHRIEDKQLNTVGHHKGSEFHKKLQFTRTGANYRSFKDDAPTTPQAPGIRPISLSLGALVSAAGMSKAPIPMNQPVPGSGMRARSQAKPPINPIKWMEGVKIGKREAGLFRRDGPGRSFRTADHQIVWDSADSLGDEISFVGSKYKKVDFESVRVAQRTTVVSLHGPWGPQYQPVFLRVILKFPEDYPRFSSPEYKLEKTTSPVSDDTITKLHKEIRSIMDHYLKRGRGCLEAMVTYLLGERDLEESITSFDVDLGLLNAERVDSSESSSDEEDEADLDYGGSRAQDLALGGTDGAGIVNANANVPLPRTTGATWSPDGHLICFFPPKQEPKPLFDLAALRSGHDRVARSRKLFSAFGRIHENSPDSRRKSSTAHDNDDELEETDSEDGFSTSSSSSTDSFEHIGGFAGRFQPPSAWKGTGRHRSSQRSSGGKEPSETAPPKPKSIVALHEFDHLLPANRSMAEQYEIFGDGPTVCAHNSDVALDHGKSELADVWNLARLILFNEVPLEVLAQTHRKEPIVTLAGHAAGHMKRKDSAIDLLFDESKHAANPMLKGRVKWGENPLAASWLISALFTYFESLADIQMLAMLACIFAEPAASEGISKTMVQVGSKQLPLSMKAPAFSIDYFASTEAAWSLYQPANPSQAVFSPAHTSQRIGSGDTFDDVDGERLGIYGSATSSNGPWGSDGTISDPITPYSTGTTPPPVGRGHMLRSSATPSFSSSPDKSYLIRRSQSNLANAFASLSRPFSNALASSPPISEKLHEEDEFSTSAPPNGVTWGVNTIHGVEERRHTSASIPRRRSGASLKIPRSYYESSDEDDDEAFYSQDEDKPPTRPSSDAGTGTTIKVTLKNQNMFDQESHASVPLLDPSFTWKFQAYRAQYAEQLSVWGLPIPQSEVLKFNGLVSYWPDEVERDLCESPPAGSVGNGTISTPQPTTTLLQPTPAEYFPELTPRSITPRPTPTPHSKAPTPESQQAEQQLINGDESLLLMETISVCEGCWEPISGVHKTSDEGDILHEECYLDGCNRWRQLGCPQDKHRTLN